MLPSSFCPVFPPPQHHCEYCPNNHLSSLVLLLLLYFYLFISFSLSLSLSLSFYLCILIVLFCLVYVYVSFSSLSSNSIDRTNLPYYFLIAIVERHQL